MKLNDKIIITLPDFIKHFDKSEFWANRFHFVRDMHPDKVYYWTEEQKKSYYAIREWIEAGENADLKLEEEGISALDSLLEGKYEITKDSFSSMSSIDMSSKIIRVDAGHDLYLPAFKGGHSKGFVINLHKIEITGNSQNGTTIRIGGKSQGTYYAGEAVYFTEVDGGCVEILPNRLRNSNMELSLISSQGKFSSTLLVQNLISGRNMTFEGVVSFAVLDNGYVYIDENGKPIYMANLGSPAKFRV